MPFCAVQFIGEKLCRYSSDYIFGSFRSRSASLTSTCIKANVGTISLLGDTYVLDGASFGIYRYSSSDFFQSAKKGLLAVA